MFKSSLVMLITVFTCLVLIYASLEPAILDPVARAFPPLQKILGRSDTAEPVAVGTGGNDYPLGHEYDEIYGSFKKKSPSSAQSQNSWYQPWFQPLPAYQSPAPIAQNPAPAQPAQQQPVPPAQPVVPENRAPYFSSSELKTIVLGETFEFYVRANDRDSDPLVISAVELPSGSTFNQSQSRFTWKPTAVSTTTAKFKVTDGKQTTTQVVTLIARAPAPIPPVEPEPPADPSIIDVKTFGAKLDGVTDDSAAVQAALDSAAQGKVVLIDGIAALGSKGISLHDKTGVTLRGKKSGDGFKALAPPNDNRPVTALYRGVLQVQNCVSCIVENITMHGNNVNGIMMSVTASRDTIIRNNDINDTGVALAAFASGGNTNNKYLNNSILRTGSDGTNHTRGMWIGNLWETEYERGTVVSGNKITYTSSTAMGITIENGLVSGNTITNRGATTNLGGGGLAIAGSPPPYSHTANTIIENNTITGAVRDAIQADGYVRAGLRSTGPLDGPDSWLIPNITIRNNHLYGNGGTGVYALYTLNWKIENNNIHDNGQKGPSFRPHGIIVGASRGITITGNKIHNENGARTQATGIYISSGYGAYIENTKVTNNEISNNSADGVLLNNCCDGITDDFTLTGNSIKDNGGFGLVIYPEQETDFKNFVIQGNTITNNAKGDTRIKYPELHQITAAYFPILYSDLDIYRALAAFGVLVACAGIVLAAAAGIKKRF